ncbi:MAG: hypothetical protein RBT11_14075 [Desulfobacterales bacterium]|jgi:hypothetical protein|nr:hypothetical protein [Desulfobacterales bacterium]
MAIIFNSPDNTFRTEIERLLELSGIKFLFIYREPDQPFCSSWKNDAYILKLLSRTQESNILDPQNGLGLYRELLLGDIERGLEGLLKRDKTQADEVQKLCNQVQSWSSNIQL